MSDSLCRLQKSKLISETQAKLVHSPLKSLGSVMELSAVGWGGGSMTTVGKGRVGVVPCPPGPCCGRGCPLSSPTPFHVAWICWESRSPAGMGWVSFLLSTRPATGPAPRYLLPLPHATQPIPVAWRCLESPSPTCFRPVRPKAICPLSR